MKNAQSKEVFFVFYDRLKEECKKQGLKMTPLIIECGGARANVTAWKNGTMPNSKIVIELAKTLNVSADYLLGITDNPKVNK